MADQYIDSTYVNNHMGSAVVTVLANISGVSLTQLIESATSRIQGALRNSGYSTPSTTTDQLVKLATFGVLREMLSDIPEAQLPLPPDWGNRSENPARILAEIVEGQIQLSGHTLTLSSAVGGWQMSSHEDTSTGYPQRASRSQMRGF